jgi:hypothetical protein
MSQDAAPSEPSRRSGNIGIPVGCILILVCFFLPWLSRTHTSGIQMAGSSAKADAAFGYLGTHSRTPILVTRVLYLVPLLALTALLLDLSVPPGHKSRFFARLGILAAGAALSMFFVHFGCTYGAQLTYGFWGSLMGALFITVGVIFDVARNE